MLLQLKDFIPLICEAETCFITIIDLVPLQCREWTLKYLASNRMTQCHQPSGKCKFKLQYDMNSSTRLGEILKIDNIQSPWRYEFLNILLVRKEIASLVGNLTVPLNTAPQLHKRLAYSSQQSRQVGLGKQIHAMEYSSALTKVGPTAGKNWGGIPSEQHLYCLVKISKIVIKEKKQVGLQYVQQRKPNPWL